MILTTNINTSSTEFKKLANSISKIEINGNKVFYPHFLDVMKVNEQEILKKLD